jgi:hypothetical protein
MILIKKKWILTHAYIVQDTKKVNAAFIIQNIVSRYLIINIKKNFSARTIINNWDIILIFLPFNISVDVLCNKWR